MTQCWWGEPWPRADYRAPVCEDDALRREVPIGEVCMHCAETITETDRGVTFPGYVDTEGWNPTLLHAHRECQLHNVLGCSASLRGEPHNHDVPYREDARRVEQWLHDHGRLA